MQNACPCIPNIKKQLIKLHHIFFNMLFWHEAYYAYMQTGANCFDSFNFLASAKLL